MPPEGPSLFGEDLYRADPGMNNGVDNRHQSWQVESTAMQLLPKPWALTKRSSRPTAATLNAHVALLAALHPGETVAMARNGHNRPSPASCFPGRPRIYVDPVYDPHWQVAHGVEPSELRGVLEARPGGQGGTGLLADLLRRSIRHQSLAEVAHGHDIR